MPCLCSSVCGNSFVIENRQKKCLKRKETKLNCNPGKGKDHWWLSCSLPVSSTGTAAAEHQNSAHITSV